MGRLCGVDEGRRPDRLASAGGGAGQGGGRAEVAHTLKQTGTGDTSSRFRLPDAAAKPASCHLYLPCKPVPQEVVSPRAVDLMPTREHMLVDLIGGAERQI